MNTPRSSTTTLIAALQILSNEIQSEDGIANAAIGEASVRMAEMKEVCAECLALLSNEASDGGPFGADGPFGAGGPHGPDGAFGPEGPHGFNKSANISAIVERLKKVVD